MFFGMGFLYQRGPSTPGQNSENYASDDGQMQADMLAKNPADWMPWVNMATRSPEFGKSEAGQLRLMHVTQAHRKNTLIWRGKLRTVCADSGQQWLSDARCLPAPGLAPSRPVLSSFQSLQQLANVVVVIFLSVQRVRFFGWPELPSVPLDVGLVNMKSTVAFGTDAEQLVETACV
jgi:hypothetical protein